VSHEELRALVGRYAAATLSESDAAVVRAHLGGGCLECLATLYALPVGVMPSREGRSWVATTVPALMAAALAVGVLWTMRRIDLERAASEALSARVATLEQRAERLEAARDTDIAVQTRELAAIRERMEEALRDAEADRVPPLPPGAALSEVERLLRGADEARRLREMVASPGLQLLPLEPIPASSSVRGHALYQRGRGTALLVVFDLPPPEGSESYRARFVTADARSSELRFKPKPSGHITLPIDLGGSAGELVRVEIVRDPDPAPLLVWARPAR